MCSVLYLQKIHSWAPGPHRSQGGRHRGGSGGNLEDSTRDRPGNFSPSSLHSVASPLRLQLRPCCAVPVQGLPCCPCRTAYNCPSSPNNKPLSPTSELGTCWASHLYGLRYHLFPVLNSCCLKDLEWFVLPGWENYGLTLILITLSGG